MVCYRRHGHNEGDDPSYTQPLMYKRIDARRSVRKLYTEALVKRGDITLEEAEAALDDFQHRLQAALDETRTHAPPEGDVGAKPPPPAVGVLPHVDTGVAAATLDAIYDARSTPRPRASRSTRSWPSSSRPGHKMFADGEVDWALAEALAFGSLLLEGTVVRLAGQDTRRGTFSHRHVVLVDYETGAEYAPLAHLGARPGASSGSTTRCCPSTPPSASSTATRSSTRTRWSCWEAQFGDFVNGAQIIIDQFLVAAEDKWGQTSGLVLLLPHGYEGQGPEHSSARIERFLTLCAEDNIQVCQRHHRGAVLPPAAPPDAPRRCASR